MTRPTLVYDADCGFCTRSARWLHAAAHGRFEVVAWQQLDLEAAGLTVSEVTSCAYWLEDGYPAAAGSDAIGAALVWTRWRFMGHVIRSMWVRPLARWIYGIVARSRHHLPGGTGNCQRRRPPEGP